MRKYINLMHNLKTLIPELPLQSREELVFNYRIYHKAKMFSFYYSYEQNILITTFNVFSQHCNTL